jgi:hypothetical protein
MPDQWGLRGDPFLWRAMSRHLSKYPFPPTENQLIALIEALFERLTGTRLPDETSINDDDAVFVKRYSRGGMSSGQVSMKFWRSSALPMLCSRFSAIRQSMSEEQ